MSYIVTNLCMLILVLVEELDCNVFLLQSSDSGEALECHGDVRIDWTSSYRNKIGKEQSFDYVKTRMGIKFDIAYNFTDGFESFNISGSLEEVLT